MIRTKGKNRFDTKTLEYTYEQNQYNLKNICVFLSHKSEDKEFVKTVGNRLMECGIDIYLDEYDKELQNNLDNPQKVVTQIENGIKNSTHVLCFITNNTVKSWWVPYELGFAKDKNKPLTSIVEKNVDCPEYIKIEKIIDKKDELEKYIIDLNSYQYNVASESIEINNRNNLNKFNSIYYRNLENYLK